MKKFIKIITILFCVVVAILVQLFLFVVVYFSVALKIPARDSSGTRYRHELVEKEVITVNSGTYSYQDKLLQIYKKDEKVYFKIFLNERVCKDSTLVLHSKDYQRPGSPYHGKYFWWEGKSLFYHNSDIGDSQIYAFEEELCSPVFERSKGEFGLGFVKKVQGTRR